MLPLIPLLMQLAGLVPTLMKYAGAGETSTKIAEQVVGVAQEVSGAKSPEEAVSILTANSEKAQEFRIRVMQQEQAWDAMYLADVQSARTRDTAIQVATGRNRRADALAYMAVAGFFVTLTFFFFGPEVSSGERDIILVMIGALLNIVTAVYSFEFGSSKDAARSTNAITDALKRRTLPPLA